jgi:outer membrane protein assembly factor BamB
MKIIFSSVTLALLFVSVFTAAFSLNLIKADDGSKASNIDWWPMFQHDVSHTGASTSNAPATNNTLWSYEAKYDAVLSPVVVDNLVYVSSLDGTFYCLNAATGALVWKYMISAVPIQGFSSPNAPSDVPSVGGGIVFVGSDEYCFYALNATTGALIWRLQMDGPIYSSATVVGNLVYVGDDGVYCLNATTGAVVWHNKAPTFVVSSPAVVEALLYVGGPYGENDSIYCLNATNGLLVWNYIVGPSEVSQTADYNLVESSPAVVDGLAYMGSYDDNVYCLDAISGTLVWKYKTEGIVYKAPAVTNGLVYVASESQIAPGYEPGSSSVYCLNATTGTPVWTKDFESPSIVSSPSIAGHIVFLGVTGGNDAIYGLNATTGAIVWSHGGVDTDGYPPVVANGVLYAGTSYSTLYAFGGSPAGFPLYLVLSLFIIALLVILLVLFIPRRKSKTETR